MNSFIMSPEIEKCIDIYDSYHFELFLEMKLKDTIGVLLESFDDEWGFPLVLDSGEKDFYSSVTSTILIGLHHINLLDLNFRNKIHETIFNLQNQSPNQIQKEKYDEDSSAWDISESANCYSTSLALQALIETDYAGDKTDIIEESLTWLSQQQRDDGGWGFDKKCVSRVFFSAHVIHALSLGNEFIDLSEKSKIEASISTGLNFIQSEMHDKDDKFACWSAAYGDSTPDPTNTLYALWILNKHERLDEKIKNKALSFLREEIKLNDIWDFNKIVEEMKTKYSSNKTIITFSPSFPLILLELGVSPFDDLCLKPIFWLKNNYENYWPLPIYNSGNLSFVYTLGLWTLIKWQKEANKHVLINGFKTEKIIKLKRRIKHLLIIIIILIILQFQLPIIEFLGGIYGTIIEGFSEYGKVPYLGSLIGIAIFIGGAIKFIPRLLRFIDARILKNKLGMYFNMLKYKALSIIYGI